MAVYVYAIVPRTARIGRALRAGRPGLRVIRGAAAAAVVRDGPRAPAPGAAALRAHDRVVRRIARHVGAVLPVRFGTVLDDDRAVRARLSARTADWRGALRAVAGREQMTLRLFGTPAPPSPGSRTPSSGTAYLSDRARALARARQAPELEPLRPALRRLVTAERIARHDREGLLLTAYHLIERGRAAEYRRTLRTAIGQAGLRALATGPWPAYAFAPELAA